jgi:hypothetical protein
MSNQIVTIVLLIRDQKELLGDINLVAYNVIPSGF